MIAWTAKSIFGFLPSDLIFEEKKSIQGVGGGGGGVMGHILEKTANRSDIDVPRLFDVVIRMQSIYFFPLVSWSIWENYGGQVYGLVNAL